MTANIGNNEPSILSRSDRKRNLPGREKAFDLKRNASLFPGTFAPDKTYRTRRLVDHLLGGAVIVP